MGSGRHTFALRDTASGPGWFIATTQAAAHYYDGHGLSVDARSTFPVTRIR